MRYLTRLLIFTSSISIPSIAVAAAEDPDGAMTLWDWLVVAWTWASQHGEWPW